MVPERIFRNAILKETDDATDDQINRQQWHQAGKWRWVFHAAQRDAERRAARNVRMQTETQSARPLKQKLGITIPQLLFDFSEHFANSWRAQGKPKCLLGTTESHRGTTLGDLCVLLRLRNLRLHALLGFLIHK